MSLKTFGRTITGSELSADGTRLLLQHPQTMAKCTSQVVPYQMPHEDGGFVILAEYGDPCPPCNPPKPKTVGGCPTACPSTQSACPEPKDPMEGELLRFEIVEYSGYDTDGQTILITTRGAEGTIKQEWGENTLVMQMPTGSELAAILCKITDVQNFLEKLGCILSIPSAEDCMSVEEGDWVCHDGCWRQALKDTAIIADDAGVLNVPAAGQPANENWGECKGFNDLLLLLSLDVEALQAWVDRKNCSGDKVDGAIVQCDEMGDGLTWDAASNQWRVDITCGPGYICMPNGCGTILWGYAVITADRTVHNVPLPVTLSAAVDPSQTSVTITDFGDSQTTDGEQVDAGDPANLTSRQSNSDLSWTSMAVDPDSNFGIYAVKSEDNALPNQTVSWMMMTQRTCA